jgi:protein-tyrosine phosphatase
VPGGWLNERSRNGSIDEVALPRGPGRLWLCGKHFVGPDPEQVLARTGAATIVCLNEAGELLDRYPGYVDWLTAEAPARAIWFPVPDLHAPTVEAVRPLLDEVVRRLDAGDGVVVHCGAGVGRAGTIAAAVLMVLGAPRAEALERVAAGRPTAGPQATAQAHLLVALEAELLL